MGEFDSAMGRLKNLEVDVAHLDGIATYLTTLSKAIDTIRERALLQAHRSIVVGGHVTENGGGGESALGSSAIEDGVVTELSTREESTYRALNEGLRAIANDLEKAAEGITKIAERYDTVEERNALTAAQWTEAISG